LIFRILAFEGFLKHRAGNNNLFREKPLRALCALRGALKEAFRFASRTTLF